jgi:hypothetical protein
MQPSDLESELRAALAAKAGRASVSPDAWGQVQRRIRRQRLSRAGTIALALGLLLVAVLAVPLARTLLPGFTPDPAPPATAPPAPPPATTADPTEATRPTGTTSLRPVRGERVDDPGAAVRALGRQPRGEPVDAIAWTDRLGDNLLILTKQETTGSPSCSPASRLSRSPCTPSCSPPRAGGRGWCGPSPTGPGTAPSIRRPSGAPRPW